MGALCTLALPWNPPERRGSSPGSSVGTAEVGLCVWGEGTQEVPERHSSQRNCWWGLGAFLVP